jgi:hypothetical protein
LSAPEVEAMSAPKTPQWSGVFIKITGMEWTSISDFQVGVDRAFSAMQSTSKLAPGNPAPVRIVEKADTRRRRQAEVLAWVKMLLDVEQHQHVLAALGKTNGKLYPFVLNDSALLTIDMDAAMLIAIVGEHAPPKPMLVDRRAVFRDVPLTLSLTVVFCPDEWVDVLSSTFQIAGPWALVDQITAEGGVEEWFRPKSGFRCR